MRHLPKAALLGVLALVATTLAAQPAAASPPAPAQPAAPLEWGPCPVPDAVDPRQECATVEVPLDYRDPSGRQIEVAISRIAASEPAERRGVMLLNPGGPGGPGIDLPSAFAQLLPEEVLARYDLIGFDPRGVQYSTPVTCGLDPATVDQTKIIPYPDAKGDIGENIAFARQMAQQCNQESGDLLRFVTTANTARDMDRIRMALGERKISYLGYSYGTYLGAVYANLYPRRTDRFILDSAVDPTRVWREVWNAWGRSVTERLPDFIRWVADRDDTYGLGQTSREVRRLYFRLGRSLDRNPVKLDDVEVDGNLFREITRGTLYGDESFPSGAETWRAIRDAVEGQPAAGAADTLAQVLQEPPPDSSTGVLWGIICNDVRWPLTPREHARDVRHDRREWPVTAGMPANIWPCAFWPTSPVEPLVPITAKGPRNILIPQTLRDPATPHFGAVNMRRALGPRARMVVVDAGGHGAYLLAQNACADQATTSFLVTGKLPRNDLFCGPAADQAQTAEATTQRQQQALDELRDRMYPL